MTLDPKRWEGATPGEWKEIPATENHGPYVYPKDGYGDICDCYTMSNPGMPSLRNGGTSHPIHFQGNMADANARLIADAPALAAAYVRLTEENAQLREALTAARHHAVLWQGEPHEYSCAIHKDVIAEIDAALSGDAA